MAYIKIFAAHLSSCKFLDRAVLHAMPTTIDRVSHKDGVVFVSSPECLIQAYKADPNAPAQGFGPWEQRVPLGGFFSVQGDLRNTPTCCLRGV